MCTSDCSFLHAGSSSLQALDANERDFLVVQLEQPEQRFHSHHWFHIAEHYLAHPLVWNTSSTHLSSPSVYIVPPSSSFYSQLTRSSVFFLLLSLPFQNIHRALVVSPTLIQSCTHQQSRSLARSSHIFMLQPFSFMEAYVNLSASHVFAIETATNNPACVRFDQEKDIYLARGKFSYPSDNWFPGPGDAGVIRGRIARYCNSTVTGSENSEIVRYHWIEGIQHPYSDHIARSTVEYKLVVYQRDRSRRLLDLEAILRSLRLALFESRRHSIRSTGLRGGDISSSSGSSSSNISVSGEVRQIADSARSIWRVTVIRHNDATDPCILHRALSDADVLLTPHGFQSLSLLFLPSGATLFEVFPFRYFKPTYRQICKQYGLEHRYGQSDSPASLSRQVLRVVDEARCMASKKCRSFARGDDIRVTDTHIRAIVDTLIAVERRKNGVS